MSGTNIRPGSADRDEDVAATTESRRRGVQRGGVWKGRGWIKVRWRDRVNQVKPVYFRTRRRNPVDHKVARLGRLEVWW